MAGAPYLNMVLGPGHFCIQVNLMVPFCPCMSAHNYFGQYCFFYQFVIHIFKSYNLSNTITFKSLEYVLSYFDSSEADQFPGYYPSPPSPQHNKKSCLDDEIICDM